MKKLIVAILAVLLVTVSAVAERDLIHELPWDGNVFEYMDAMNNYDASYGELMLQDWDAFTEMKDGHWNMLWYRSSEMLGWGCSSYSFGADSAPEVYGAEIMLSSAYFLPRIEDGTLNKDVYSSRLYMIMFQFYDELDAKFATILDEITKIHGDPKHIVGHSSAGGRKVDRYTIVGDNGIRLILDKHTSNKGTEQLYLYLGRDGVDAEITQIFDIAGVEHR